MKLRKKKDKLKARVEGYEESIKRMSLKQARGYRRPGSLSGRARK